MYKTPLTRQQNYISLFLKTEASFAGLKLREMLHVVWTRKANFFLLTYFKSVRDNKISIHIEISSCFRIKTVQRENLSLKRNLRLLYDQFSKMIFYSMYMNQQDAQNSCD